MKMNWLGLSVLVVGFSAGTLRAETGKAMIGGTQTGLLISGTVLLEDTPGGLKVDADITQAPVGKHAFHIHEFGSCAEEAKAAGSHYNPANQPHGDVMKSGIAHTHAGDFGSLTVDATGKASLHAVVPGLTLSHGKYSVAGRAFVLHEKEDDFSQPAGNAGSRLGCGPILITGK